MSRTNEFEDIEGEEVIDMIVDVGGTVNQSMNAVKINRGNKCNRQYQVEFIIRSEEDATWMTQTELVYSN